MTRESLRAWLERRIRELAASDVGARQDRAAVIKRLLKDYDTVKR